MCCFNYRYKNKYVYREIVELGDTLVRQYLKEDIGSASYLVQTYSSPVLKYLIHRSKWFETDFYDNISITVDGTPPYAEDEAVVGRIITKK